MKILPCRYSLTTERNHSLSNGHSLAYGICRWAEYNSYVDLVFFNQQSYRNVGGFPVITSRCLMLQRITIMQKICYDILRFYTLFSCKVHLCTLRCFEVWVFYEHAPFLPTPKGEWMFIWNWNAVFYWWFMNASSWTFFVCHRERNETTFAVYWYKLLILEISWLAFHEKGKGEDPLWLVRPDGLNSNYNESQQSV